MIKTPDIIISVLYILGIVSVGLWAGLKGRRKRPAAGSAIDGSPAPSSSDYFLAGKTLKWPMIGLALFATNISCLHLVSLAQSGFDTGLLSGNFEWMASFTLILLALFFAPFYIRSGVSTLPDFLERRYNRVCRDWLTFVSILSAIIIHIAFSLLTGSIELLGNKSHGILCDVSGSADVEDAIRQTLKKYGRIDVIHNNAGIAHPSRPVHETEEAEWDRLFNVNLKSIFYTTRYGLDALKLSKGCILNTSSLVGEIGQENHAAYAATKGAINALTKSMALDYAPYKIRVNAVAPAGVWTRMLREWGQAQENTADIEKYLDGIHALGYCPEGDVVADACVFLVSEKARFITGNILPVSGGAELGYRRILYPGHAAEKINDNF